MICSSEPDGMMRASTASARSSSAEPLRRPGRLPTDAASPSYGTIVPVCPRDSMARESSRVCQPWREARTTMCTRYLVSTAIRASSPPVANLRRSSPTFLNPGVAVPFLSASMDGKQSSAWR